ncbi:LacI family DNA-binding transcriptional regulator [Clostridium sp. SYSU_GA19001]|uniref:LacI family DNA-binding transcriptional regulator n=1 Tax=Clostridium caldaquaticum TaxID=2940653 RepID=UPI0020770126|nr:LacI family DNA-binding transcriptional regulator [Clostridium caldaquaticum]MCM8711551.1 LacI family DNA-binding transcriptional regulator [Clostridium caldaquaticum]
MKTIMQDIAKLAGVSPGTVSNALNNKKGVSKETRERILKIAEEMGYYRNNKEESNIIRFIIFKKQGYVVSDTPFFSALIEGIERECRAEGFELIVSHVIHNEHSDEDIQEIIKQDQIAGVLLLATEMDESDLEPFKKLSIPVIILDNYFNNADFDYVLINNVQGAYQAVKYLVEKGHKEIGCLGSSKIINNFRYRYEGFKEALIYSNLNIHHEYEVVLEPTLEGAYRDMKEVLNDKNFKLPTAYFAFNDIIAFGAIRAMKEKGIKIPEDVSIVGFDDMPFCEISSPRLSTIRVYKQYIGKTAVKRLIQKITDRDEVKLKMEIKTELVERESVLFSPDTKKL